MRKLSFLRSLKGCLKSRVAFVDFMFIGQCGSLVLERFSAAVAKEAIDPFAVPVQKSSATVGHVPRRISCVCSQRRFDATPHRCSLRPKPR